MQTRKVVKLKLRPRKKQVGLGTLKDTAARVKRITEERAGKKTFKRPQGGRPPFIPTLAQKSLVESLVAAGLTHIQIAELVINPNSEEPVSVATLERHFASELRLGLAKANATIAGALFTSARDGNTTAQMFWLSRRAKWKETNVLEVGGIPGQPIEVQNAHQLIIDKLDQMEERIRLSGRTDGHASEPGGTPGDDPEALP